MQKMRQRDQFQTSFYLKRLYMRKKLAVYSLVSVHFDSPQLDMQ